MSEIFDTVIIGNGPAGITAGIYAARAGLRTLIVSGYGLSGGQITETYEIDNYPGLFGISGQELGERFDKHIKEYDVAQVMENMTAILDPGADVKKVKTDAGEYLAKTVIIANGAGHAKLSVPGEEKLAGAGVSYCATCDGAFFKGKEVAVVGGGDTAFSDALFLSRLCSKVYLIHRREGFRAAKVLIDKVFSEEKIEPVLNTVVEEIKGDDVVGEILVKDVKTGEKRSIPVSGIFIAVGINPNTDFEGVPERDEKGFIAAGEDCHTSIPGIFAAGDIRTKTLRQVITACSDGAVAATEAERYLATKS